MESTLKNESITKEKFKEYIDKIINIFRLSSKNNSILLDLKLKNYQANAHLSILNNHTGEREELNSIIMDCDNDFTHYFLLPLVEKMKNIIIIETIDIVENQNSKLFTFRMITTNNDLFTIDGLSKNDANNLLEKAKEFQLNNKIISTE